MSQATINSLIVLLLVFHAWQLHTLEASQKEIKMLLELYEQAQVKRDV